MSGSSNMLHEALATLRQEFLEHASVEVLYFRGEESVALRASDGRTVWQMTGDNGVLVEYQSRDFIVDPADLVIDGERIEPAQGDRVQVRDGAVVRVFQVCSPGDGPVFRLNAAGTALRIHGKEIDVQAGEDEP